MIPIAADAKAIDRAAQILREGGVVAMPTETVYGLAADATNARAVARIFDVKRRPRFNPLIAHVRDLDEATVHADLHELAIRLAERFWPGPLTIVAPRRAESAVAELACAGLSTIALRAPAHPVARALIETFAAPLAAPSANRSGRVSPTSAAHVAEDLGSDVDLILDGGKCAVGVESTIVRVDAEGEARLLRPGGIAREEIEGVAGPLKAYDVEGEVEAPGMLGAHYAPRAMLRLDAEAPCEGEIYLGFGARDGALNLSRAGDLAEAAASLYAHLRALDSTGAVAIAVAPIPAQGLGEAIADRLRRAAAPRQR